MDVERTAVSFDGLVCDLDGVVYRGSHAIDGAVEALARLDRAGVPVVFCTNNSRRTVAQYVAILGGFGLEVSPRDVVTSAVVTAETLARRGVRGGSAIVVGGDGVREALASIGVEVDDDPERTEADLVVVGFDPRFDYAAMTRAARAVRGGATFVATNDDASFPAPGGVLVPGAGALLASIEVGAGRRAEVMGKPHRPMMETCAARLDGCRRIALVGDRPDTDLAGAAAMGWTRVLVLSGVTSPDEASALSPRPDAILSSLAELVPQ